MRSPSYDKTISILSHRYIGNPVIQNIAILKLGPHICAPYTQSLPWLGLPYWLSAIFDLSDLEFRPRDVPPISDNTHDLLSKKSHLECPCTKIYCCDNSTNVKSLCSQNTIPIPWFGKPLLNLVLVMTTGHVEMHFCINLYLYILNNISLTFTAPIISFSSDTSLFMIKWLLNRPVKAEENNIIRCYFMRVGFIYNNYDDVFVPSHIMLKYTR